MEFCEFAKIVRSFMFPEMTQPDSLKKLISSFVEKPQEDKNINDYNPLNEADDSLLNKYYSGKRNLSKSIARKILSRMDKARFCEIIDEYLHQVTYDAQENFRKELNLSEEDNIPEKCSDIFEGIIKRIVYKERKTSTKKEKQLANNAVTDLADDVKSETTDDVEKASDTPEDEIGIATFTYTYCFQCRGWRGDKKSAIIDKNVVQGKCSFLNKDTLSNEGKGCPKFRTSSSFNIMDIINPNK